MNVSTKFPIEIGPIHFIGIGGIGMSGIAEILINQGYSVQGSDLKETEITLRLERMGASIKIGHDKNNLKSAAVVVISSAINKKNPELNYARSAGLPVVRRAEMLAELMRMKSLMCLRLLRSEALVADFSTLRAFLHHIIFRLEDLLATQLRHFEFHEVDLHEGHLHEVASSGSSKRRNFLKNRRTEE